MLVKKSVLIALAVAVQAVAGHIGGSAHAHRRTHAHHHHARQPITKVVSGPTVVVYEFNGHNVPVDEVCQGIKNGTFEWTAGHEDAPDCGAYGLSLGPAAAAVSTAVADVPAAASSALQAVVVTTSSLAAAAVPSSSNVGSGYGNGAAASQSSGSTSNGLSGYDAQIAVNSNVDKEFPDGQIDCSEFPSAYGAVPVDWVGLQGWSGIQYTSMNAHVVTHIDTGIHGSECKNPGNGAVAYCSYACPAGYQKSQWPSTQGGDSMAVSVGGLMCGTDGKLHLTNPGLSKNLCIPGTGAVTVANRMSASNAICRTDYPGTESETVPLVVQQGGNSPLTCPDSSTYYKHLNMPTTAEYYVNMKGVPVNEACIWGQDGSHKGNWAPAVFGVGMDQNAKTWLSIQSTIQNQPSSYADLDFTVELQGDFGGSKCFYKNGYYCSKGDPSNFNPSDCQTVNTTAVPGCTVQLLSGNATYVLTD